MESITWFVIGVGVFPRVRRLAEKYSESQTTKEKIQKSIEVKKEHLSSLQPGLNAIMQVSLSPHLHGTWSYSPTTSGGVGTLGRDVDFRTAFKSDFIYQMHITQDTLQLKLVIKVSI